MADIIRLQAHVKEHLTRQYLQKKGDWLFSPDWIIKPNNRNDNKIVFVEVKEKYERTKGIFIKGHPPIQWENGGHGFNYNQYLNYMNIYRSLGIRTLLIIYDETDKHMYEQYLDVLEKTESSEQHILKSNSDGQIIITWSINNFIDVGEY